MMNAALNAAQLHSKTLPDLIHKLLMSRQESLVLFHRLAMLKSVTPTESVSQLLRRFRQSLVDYLALGPFEVYEALEEQAADSPYRQARDVARRLYTRIHDTTQTALDFHDRYEDGLAESALPELNQELSRLGESLATRIELEDRIVAAVRHVDTPIAV